MSEFAILIVRTGNGNVVRVIRPRGDSNAQAQRACEPPRPSSRPDRRRHPALLQLLVLEHHRHGLTPRADEGPPSARPLLAPWLRRAESPAGELLLEYGDEIVAVEGFSDLDDDALAILRPEGVVVEPPVPTDEEALREAALGHIAPSLAAHRLSRARVAVVGSGAIAEETARLLPGRVRRIGWNERPSC